MPPALRYDRKLAGDADFARGIEPMKDAPSPKLLTGYMSIVLAMVGPPAIDDALQLCADRKFHPYPNPVKIGMKHIGRLVHDEGVG